MIYHQETFAATGLPGTEESAEAYGQKMLARFLARAAS
jgi:hypothetical protein